MNAIFSLSLHHKDLHHHIYAFILINSSRDFAMIKNHKIIESSEYQTLFGQNVYE